jgi:hypothetical protein
MQSLGDTEIASTKFLHRSTTVHVAVSILDRPAPVKIGPTGMYHKRPRYYFYFCRRPKYTEILVSCTFQHIECPNLQTTAIQHEIFTLFMSLRACEFDVLAILSLTCAICQCQIKRPGGAYVASTAPAQKPLSVRGLHGTDTFMKLPVTLRR